MRDVGLSELIRRGVEGRLLDVRTSMAAVVVSFDAATLTASVRPAVRVQAVDADSPPEVDTLPILEGVPVQFPHWGPAVLYHPLSPGDVGRLEWSEEDDARVYDDAGAPLPVNPTILRRHGASAVFRPEGFRGGAPGGLPASGWLGRPGGVGIAFDAAEVRLGDAAAADAVALDPATRGQINALRDAVGTALGLITGGPTPVSTAAAVASLNGFASAPVGATKVKAL